MSEIPHFFPKNFNELIWNKEFIRLYEKYDSWAIHGAYYGFPSCCIENFCTKFAAQIYDKHPNHPMKGTGYVPCSKCIEVSKNRKLFENFINESRACSVSFPNDSTEEELGEFFCNIIKAIEKNPIKEMGRYANLSYLVNASGALKSCYLHTKNNVVNVSALKIFRKSTLMKKIEQDDFVFYQLENILSNQFKNDEDAQEKVYESIRNGDFKLSSSQ